MGIKVLFSGNKVGLLTLATVKNVFQTISYTFYSTSIDSYLQCLVVEEGCKKDLSLLKYFGSFSKNITFPESTGSTVKYIYNIDKWNSCSGTSSQNVDLINQIEHEMKEEISIPNEKLYFILTCFVKNGNIDGVKAIQLILEKNNMKHFKLFSEYKHYLAEALWINGKIEDSLELFTYAYNNEIVRPQVIVMLKCLIPLLISQHSEIKLYKTVCSIERFSVEKNDFIILAYIWKELFLSGWFSDQQLSKELVQRNVKLLSVINFIIPTMGKMVLKQHDVDTFYRLFEFSLENQLNQDGLLIRLLFDYYYTQQNIERCTAVVKYTDNKDNCPLTDEQQRRYVSLLLKSKNTFILKQNVRKSKVMKFKF